MALFGIRSGVPKENSSKVPGKYLENSPKLDTALNLVPTFCAGCVLKSTVTGLQPSQVSLSWDACDRHLSSLLD